MLAAKRRLIVEGYVRSINITNDQFDYTDLLMIIVSYLLQRYSRFHHGPVHSEIKFGDIVKTSFSGTVYKIMNINGKLVNAGRRTLRSRSRHNTGYKAPQYLITLHIPFEICKYLTNAPDFFSRITEKHEFKRHVQSFTKRFDINYDDGYIINKFGSALNAQYNSIRLYTNKSNKGSLYIDYDGTHQHSFPLGKFVYSSKDFENFYEIRKHPERLIKIDVDPRIPILCYKLYSPLWDLAFTRVDYPHDCTWSWVRRYIGPETEKEGMTKILKEYYGDVSIMVGNVQPQDLLMWNKI